MTITIYPARRLITMNPRQPEAAAVAVKDGRILGVGSVEDLLKWGPATIDERFKDKVIMPGLIEGHCHLKEGGMWSWTYLGWFDRRDPSGHVWAGLKSMQAVVERLTQVDAEMTAKGLALDQPLLAWGFDPIYFGGERMDVHHLSGIARPIVITHANGHLMNVNTIMLKLADITAATDVEGVVKDAQGEPTGELQEPTAMHLVIRKVGNAGLLSPMDDAGMLNFSAIACMQGVTTATDLVNDYSDGSYDLLARATSRDDYRVRLYPAFRAFHGAAAAAKSTERVLDLMKRNTEKLRFGIIKLMLDGSIQGFSARMRWPGYFNGAPNGIWVMDPKQYEEDFEVYHRAGLQVHTHTNADQASEAAIEAIEGVLTRSPRPDHRHTLQHAQMIDAAMFRKMAQLGLCVNVFSNHIWYWGDQHYEMTMGPDRANRMNDARAALDCGVALAIHSDAPVTPLGPLFTAWCAVNRVTPSGRVLGPNHRITVTEALHAITMGAAWTLKADHEIGSLEVGKRADFAVLEDDPLAIDPIKLKDVRVWGTVLNGQVFEAGH